MSYFAKLVQAAYSTISNTVSVQEELFIKLCTEFPKMMDVLNAMRDSSHTIDLLQSLELWHETGSQLSWQRLCEATNALPMSSNPNKSVH